MQQTPETPTRRGRRNLDMDTISITLPRPMLEHLRELAAERDAVPNVSALIREAVARTFPLEES